jgi:phospholipid/cholesterol/gamma-HCH transport system substrate-binding protein
MIARHKMGVAVFVAITGLMTLFIAFQVANVGLDGATELRARFRDAGGLFPGDEVRIAGVPVGAVKGIEVVRDDGGHPHAEVVFTVRRDIPVPDDSVATIRWLTVVGFRIVDLQPGDSTTFLGHGDRVEQTRPGFDLNRLGAGLTPFLRTLDPRQFNLLLETIVEGLEGNEANIERIFANVNALFRVLADRDETIGQVIEDYTTVTSMLAERDDQIRRLIDDLVLLVDAFCAGEDILEDAFVEVEALVGDLGDFIETNRDNLGVLLTDLATVTDHLRERLDEVEEGVMLMPRVLRELDLATNRGRFVDINLTCFSLTRPPCTGLGPGGPIDTIEDLLDLLLGGLR